MTTVIPYTQIRQFRRTNTDQRWGQEFYDFMKLEKVQDPEDKAWCDELYNEPDDARAKVMVLARIDYNA